jgi:uncharacterized phiE125 gp8 family phage protein
VVASTLVTGPTSEPVTVTEAKSHLRVDGSEMDSQVVSKIPRARKAVENHTRRALITQTWDFKYDCLEDRIDLPLQPVQSVTYITYVDDDGETQTLAEDQYQVVGTGAENLCHIVPAYGVSWPSVRDQPEAVIVRCIVGYGAMSAVPEPLREAVLLILENLIDRPAHPITGAGVEATAAYALMDPYRVVRL